MCVADVEFVAAFRFDTTPPLSREYVLREALCGLSLLEDSPTKTQALLQIPEVLCAGDVAENFHNWWQKFPSLSACAHVLNDVLSAPSNITSARNRHSPGSVEHYFLDTFQAYARGRSLIRGNKQTFGLAPQATQPGDVIAIVLGLESALILRPTAGNEYKLVGESSYMVLQAENPF